jgi:hypothetical protein
MIRNIIKNLTVELLIQYSIVFIVVSIMLPLYKHFYSNIVISCQIFCKKVFRTPKQNVWYLVKTNLGKHSLCHCVFFLAEAIN